MKVSVIVPIYKVEAFITKCADSLLGQTLDEVEYVFVDDASPDESVERLQAVIERYPQRQSQVKLVRLPENRGLPAARNAGMEKATGKYVFHCDSDDFVDANMLEELYREAVRQDADIVWCDWFLSFARRERYMKQPAYSTPDEALRAMLAGRMKFTVWNKLVRRQLYEDHKITFPAGYGMGEDMTMMLLFACANRVVYIPRAFYHYVKLNPGSFTQTHSDRHVVELDYNVKRVALFLKERFGNQYDCEIAFLKLSVKFPLLISNDKDKYRLWTELYPEANCYIPLNDYVSRRCRLLQELAWRKKFWIVRLHYLFLQKLFYGLIYR